MSEETTDPADVPDAAASEPAKAAPKKPKEKAKDKNKKPDKKAKDGKKDKDGKKGKKGKKSDDAADGLSVASHPRAVRQVRRAKGWGGLAGFALAAYFSYSAQIPLELIGVRALVAGVAGYMVAWACSVTVWRHLVLAELRATAESMQASGPGGTGAAGEANNETAPGKPR